MKISELKKLLKLLNKLENEPDFDEWFECDFDDIKGEILTYIDFLGDDDLSK